MKIFLTGIAGFIGFHVAKKLCDQGHDVIAIDSINNYYDEDLKKARLENLGINNSQNNNYIISTKYENLTFKKLDLTDSDNLNILFEEHDFEIVCNLAAQAGVRYSISNPSTYIDSNIYGFLNLLEASRKNSIKHVVYASSSSVYGLNADYPYSVSQSTDHPASLYAASKKSNELIAHSYSHIHKIPTTGLRFFTVYGPWGRPDMAYFIFTKAAYEGQEILIFNNGDLFRDFTYIDDIVDGISVILETPFRQVSKWDNINPDNSFSSAPYRIYNIGNNTPINLIDFVEIIESITNKKIKKKMMGMQPGDIYKTFADIDNIKDQFGFNPKVDIKSGLTKFNKWYKEYYNC